MPGRSWRIPSALGGSSCPVGVVIGAGRISFQWALAIDGVLVVRDFSTHRLDVDWTTELVGTWGVPPLGMLGNGVTRQQMDYGYEYGYGDPSIA